MKIPENPEKIIRMLGLSPLPREGGWYRETFRMSRPSGFISDNNNHSIATSIYYLLGPGQHSRLHSLPKSEIYFHHAGAPLGLLVLGEDQFPFGREIILGSDLEVGQIPQFEVPAGAIHGSRPLGSPGWSLVSTVMVPGYVPDDYKEPDIQILCNQYVLFAEIIKKLG